MFWPRVSLPTSGKGLVFLASRWMVVGIVVASLGVTAAVTTVLYASMQRVFRAAIDERLMSMASIAATVFDPEDLEPIEGRQSVGTSAYERAVRNLQRIRSQAANVRYAYILRSTSDPNTMEFVADADSLHPDQEIDLNGDGAITDEDALAYPGDPYDVSSFPEFQQAAFSRSFVDPDFTVSQWGVFLAGTTPIRYASDPTRPTVYVLGLDLEITEYQALLQQVFLPFLAFAAFLLVVIGLQALALRGLWNRQVRQMAEIDRQKDELISIVSHQLGSPITSVRWSLESMQDGDLGQLTEEQKQHVQSVIATTFDLTELVNLLLEVSRFELGRIKVSRQDVDLDAFLREIVDAIAVQAKEKGVRLTVAIPPSLPQGRLDKRLTRMTLENLLGNAVKYTPEGGSVTFTVEMRDDSLFCEVRDTGCGIPKEDQKQLFAKLFRASNVRDTIEGNGFGLYIAKGAVERQGGKISFVSEPNRGTTFFVQIPTA